MWKNREVRLKACQHRWWKLATAERGEERPQPLNTTRASKGGGGSEHQGHQEITWSPIILGNERISVILSRVIAFFLRSHVLILSSYIQDIIHLLQRVAEIYVSKKAYLEGTDVEARYSSIPQNMGLVALEFFL